MNSSTALDGTAEGPSNIRDFAAREGHDGAAAPGHLLDALPRLGASARSSLISEMADLQVACAQAEERLEGVYDMAIEALARALDLKDHETEGHSRRVTELAVRLARAMGIPEDQIVHVRRGALLHDVGKIGVPDAILLKPGNLDAIERRVMQRHVEAALEILEPIAFLGPALDIPRCHHERWDGKGYPRGLAGERIPLAARIFAVIDVYDALSHDRVYRKAWPQDKVCDYLRSMGGNQFDPSVVAVFMDLIKGGRTL